MSAMLLTFWRYMLPPSSRSKCIEWMSFYAYIGTCFKKKGGRRESGDWYLVWANRESGPGRVTQPVL
jgi:hypothetical protein